MKKGTFTNFLGRKNHSLFDTNIEIKERDNVELVLDSSAIPESGTAKVRARPTVKHFSSSTSSTDIMHGFAVPTPKVPVLSTFGVPNTNGTGGKLSNGVSVPDLAERDIFIPPPPSMAPPPPPPSMAPPPPPSQLLIPPPADFSFESPSSPLYEDPGSLQPPPMPPPKPPSKTPSPHSSWVPEHTSLKPPPMAPPKPPSNPSSAKVSAPISTALNNGPECPKFAPPKPPASAERPETPPPKGFKVPPPKPTRLSSMFQDSQDNLPHIPAPARPAPGPTASTFNPQHTAKLYTVPKAGILTTEVDLEKTPKAILLLQDTSTDPIPTQLDGKMSSDNKDLGSDKLVVPPTKPVRKNSGGLQLEKDLQDLKESLQSTLPAQPVKVQEDATVTPLPLQPPQELKKPTQPTPTASPIPENTPPTTLYGNSPGRSRKLIPYVSRTPYYLRPTESSTPGATSPLALLQAAKEREKQRGALSRENSSNSNIYSQPTSVSIHQNQSTPNSFTVVPRPTSSLSQGGRDSPDLHQFSRVETDSASASPSRPLSSSSLVAELLEKHDTEAAPTAPDATLAKETKGEEAKEDVSVPFIPPPPEFANSDTEEESGLEQLEPPPSFPPPDPPSQKVPSRFPTPAVQHPPIMVPPTPNPPSQKVPSPFPTPAVQAPPIMVPPPPADPPSQKVPSPSPTPAVQPLRSTLPPPPPKPKGAKPPNPPQLPVQKTEVKPKPPSQDKLKPQPPLPPAQSLSPSQATLLSILQKKMLEMDQKHSFEEVQANNDDWGTSEEPTVPVKPSPIPKFKSSSTLPRQTPGLDMSELEQKVSKKAQDLSAATKSATSNGSQSKQPYGMTFTVRPGTKHPIMPVIKGDAP